LNAPANLRFKNKKVRLSFGEGLVPTARRPTVEQDLERIDKPRWSLTQVLATGLLVLLLGLSLLLHEGAHLFARDDDPNALNQRVTQLCEQAKYKEALPIAERAVELAKHARGPDHSDTANALNNLGFILYKTGDYAKAEPLLEESLRVYRKVLGSEDPAAAVSLDLLAQLYLVAGKYDKAEPLLQEALQVRQKVLGPEHRETMTSLNDLAMLYQKRGEYAKAEPLFQQALQIEQKVLGFEHPDTARSLSNLGELYKAMGDYAKAEPLLQEAFRIFQKILGPEHLDTAAGLNNLAGLYWTMHEYNKAEPLMLRTLAIDEASFGSDDPNVARDRNNLGELYEAKGEYDKAEPHLQEALRIAQKVLGKDHPDVATGLDNLAGLYKEMGNYPKAEQLLQEALRIRHKVLPPEHPLAAQSLNDLAELYEQRHQYDKAEPFFQEALRIDRKVLGPEHPDTTNSLNNLGSLYLETGQYDKAEPLLLEALRIYQNVLGPEHLETAQSLNNLAYLKLDTGEIQEAKRVSQLAYDANLKVFDQMLSFGSEDQRLAYQYLQNPYTLLAALDDTDALLAGAVLHYKGAVLDSVIEDRLLAEKGDQALVDQLNAKKRTVAQLSLQATPASSKETSERIRALEQEVDDIQDKLARQVTGLGQARRALTITPQQVQSSIPTNAALIEYVRYSRYLGKSSKLELHYGAVVLAAAGSPLWVPIAPAEELERLVASYQKSAQGQTDSTKLETDLRELYDRLWLPVEHALPRSCQRVILSPDAELNFVSFATLLDSERHFLAERYELQYVASGHDLLREAPLPPLDRPTVVIFANPDLTRIHSPPTTPADREVPIAVSATESVLGAEKREIEDLNFGPLPGTQQECDRLKEAFTGWHWSTEPLTGSRASKAALQQLHSPDILHLATHGFFERAKPSDTQSPEQLPVNFEGNGTRSQFFKNPMHRAGLVLAGGQSTLKAWKQNQTPPAYDDGIVTAEDVSMLDLKRTWLVTLSACQTGSGQAQAGEGVLGLRRGFVQAGTQNLLMTLWPIDDEVTVQIMVDFYGIAHQGGNAAQALADVQRDWLVALRDGQGEHFDKVRAALRRHGLDPANDHGIAVAVRFAGPFILSSQGKP
jgi:tetratricopeptide (TPR) repeat protein/CHAT domain-containing protein